VTTYRWRGIDSHGASRCGKTAFARPSSLGTMVATRWRTGWRELFVAEGDGPVPPGRDEQPVAVISRNADNRRVWWAE
jgi:hypothetical protein